MANKILYLRTKTVFFVFVTFARGEVTMGSDCNLKHSATLKDFRTVELHVSVMP